MKQCPKGHIYDEKRSAECPYCADSSGFQPIGLGGQPDFPKTVPIVSENDAAGGAFPPTMPVDNGAGNAFSSTTALDSGAVNSGMSVTIALEETESGINPVRGWLVAIDGDHKGTAFLIHGEQNSVGRGNRFDINLSFDRAVSSEGNAVIAYDSKNRKFFISPTLGKGKNNVYVNDSILLVPVELHDYDRIQVGSSTYAFRSFCNEEYTY